MNDDSLFLLDESMAAIAGPNLQQKGDFSFVCGGNETKKSALQKQKDIDVTFAEFLNATQGEIDGESKSKSRSGGRPSNQSSKQPLSDSRLSKGSQASSKRARWSLPSETSMQDDGVTLSDRYNNRKVQKGKSSEEL